MADLRDVLPRFDLQPWRHLTYSLEKKNVLTSELVSQDPVEIAKRCPLPLKEVRRLVAAVNAALRADISLLTAAPASKPHVEGDEPPRKKLRTEPVQSVKEEMRFVSTLDTHIDQCLGGGFPTGNICEIVGESAAGKTQFVLGLLLSAQLPAPKGLGRPVIYLSTEDKLNTSRLYQILQSNPEYQDLSSKDRPSLDRIYTISIHNFEQQENIILYKLPSLVEENNVGLLVIDSVAANFRIQFQGASPAVLSRRAIALAKLGNVLKKIAHKHNIAIVIANQVADRFDEARIDPNKFRNSSSAPSSSAAVVPNTPSNPVQTTMGPPPTPTPKPALTSQAEKDEIMRLDYQQCFFTGWGDDPDKFYEALKTPALGLTWANQINARIVLKIAHDTRPVTTENIYSEAKRVRHLSVVFAPWIPPTTMPVQYELCMQGPVSVPLPDGQVYTQVEGFDDEDGAELEEIAQAEADEIKEMLDPKYWEDDPVDDDEFS